MPSLRIHVFQHVPFEGLGCMEAWIRSRGHRLTVTSFHAGELPPTTAEMDWLIVMGGPMGVHDEAEFPWLKEEKRAIREALAGDKTILGICLGAQLLAHVLGADVRRNHEKEIGWFPVRLESDARGIWPGTVFPPIFTAFHWHGDTFEIPPGAVHLLSSDACANQGFLHGDKVLGLQFHPEITPAVVDDWSGQISSEPNPSHGNYVQTREAMLQGMGYISGLNRLMEEICAALEARSA